MTKSIITSLFILSATISFGEGRNVNKDISTAVIYLSGHGADDAVEWDFRCSGGMNSGRWQKIDVPSCWEQQGFGEYTYGRYYKKPGGRASDENGLYRRTFRVPSAWNGRKVEIVFEGVMTDAAVTVNGISAGDVHQGGFTAFSYDISGLLRYGKTNTLEVMVEKQSKDKSVNSAERRADWWLSVEYTVPFICGLCLRYTSLMQL